jgi:hypothetical protein
MGRHRKSHPQGGLKNLRSTPCTRVSGYDLTTYGERHGAGRQRARVRPANVRPCAVERGVACTGGLAPARRAALATGISRTALGPLRRSRSVGGFGHLFGPLASLRTHHDSEWRYSEWSGCQYRAPPSRASQVAAHQRGSGESISARRRDQGLVG